MNAQLVQWAADWRSSRKLRHSPRLRLLVGKLSQEANYQSDVTTVDNAKLAEYLDCSIRTVQRAIHELIAQGPLEVRKRFVKGRGQIANVYHLIVEIAMNVASHFRREPPRGCLHQGYPACDACLREHERRFGTGPPAADSPAAGRDPPRGCLHQGYPACDACLREHERRLREHERRVDEVRKRLPPRDVLPPTWGPIGSLAERLLPPDEFERLRLQDEEMRRR